jgi:hypothetical protein
MLKFVPVLVLITTGAIAAPLTVMAQLQTAAVLSDLFWPGMSGPDHAILPVGGMGGGGTGGGMGGGGMTGGGMGGATAGGMGGMTGAPGSIGSGMAGGGMGSYGTVPAYDRATGFGGGVQPYGSNETSGDGAQSLQHYHCVTQHGQCSVASSSSLRPGATCGCLLGGQGKIK